MQPSLLRSLLFVPGNSEKMLLKALQVHADALVPDLEDSVPKEEKVAARNLVSKMLPSLRAQVHKRVQIIPRVNSFYTQWFEEDLKAVLQLGVSAVTIGKVETAEEMKEIVKAIAEKEKEANLPSNSIKLIPWLETAKGVAYAREICASGSRLAAIAFGAEDFTADMQIERTSSGKEFYHARSWVCTAARASKLPALDSPWPHFRDLQGLEEDCRVAKAMGYKGKFSIHPGNIDIINKQFSPSTKEVEFAKKIVEAFEVARKAGRGSTSVNGTMVDEPVYRRARAVIEQESLLQDSSNASNL
ncbi:hypothetical protein GpartN1_g5437.t1 [Galdieria partita]|uniref:HpcH/HpaI aldolase/citrate lyase domain-containing protein n=1 Tax=Galdieria partita TaxID=83374 RepID=A0A9C7US42_9RHOD|nr:hypothetical protein GpartN1_g5437.t1 [Galdieria partita]